MRTTQQEILQGGQYIVNNQIWSSLAKVFSLKPKVWTFKHPLPSLRIFLKGSG